MDPEAEPPTGQPAEPDEGAEPDATGSWRQKCLRRTVLNLTFSMALFAGTSLFLSGFFTEYLSPDETLADDSQYGSILALSFGLLVVLYSTFGLCSSCCLKFFCEKYILVCSINAFLTLASLTFVAFAKSGNEVKTMDVRFED